MTTILYHKGRVYADSTVVKGSERLDCLTKIQALEKPLRIFSDREDYAFDDVVHGYTGTGSQPGMAGLVEMLEVDQNANENAHGMIAHFRMAYDCGLCVNGNTFEVLLIGEKANHSLCFDSRGFVYTHYEKEKIVAMGSGCQEVMAHIQHHGDGVRAMLETFVTDSNSGGWIDCWEMKEVTETVEEETTTRWVFRRRGMREPIPKDLIRIVLETHWPKPGTDKVPLQFRRQAQMKTELTRIYLENKQLAEERAQLEADHGTALTFHKNEITKLKKKIAQMRREAKPITVKDLKLPPKIEVPEAAAAQVRSRRRLGKTPVSTDR